MGYLRDVRRLTVALSRARLGLYILGRREVFESCFELKPAFDLLKQRPDKLMLIPGEMFPTTRLLSDDDPGTPMEGIEHLGQYVFEMTEAKIKAMDSDGVTAPVRPDSDDEMRAADEEEEADALGEEY